MGFSATDFEKIYEYSGKDFLSKEFKDFVSTPKCNLAGQTFDIGIKIDLSKFQKLFEKKPKGLSDEEKEKFEEERKPLKAELEKFGKETAEKFSTFRVKIYSNCLDKMLVDIKGGKVPKPISIHLNKDNILHLIPYKDRVSLIYGIQFTHTTDQSLARVFLQEIKTSKNHVKNALQYNIYTETDEVPKTIIEVDQPKKYSNGLLTVDVFTKNYDVAKKFLNYLITLREFIQFHIHSIKTFLHIRMNKKGKDFERKLEGCQIIPVEYLKNIEALQFYTFWNKKEESAKVFTSEVKKLNVK